MSLDEIIKIDGIQGNRRGRGAGRGAGRGRGGGSTRGRGASQGGPIRSSGGTGGARSATRSTGPRSTPYSRVSFQLSIVLRSSSNDVFFSLPRFLKTSGNTTFLTDQRRVVTQEPPTCLSLTLTSVSRILTFKNFSLSLGT